MAHADWPKVIYLLPLYVWDYKLNVLANRIEGQRVKEDVITVIGIAKVLDKHPTPNSRLSMLERPL